MRVGAAHGGRDRGRGARRGVGPQRSSTRLKTRLDLAASGLDAAAGNLIRPRRSSMGGRRARHGQRNTSIRLPVGSAELDSDMVDELDSMATSSMIRSLTQFRGVVARFSPHYFHYRSSLVSRLANDRSSHIMKVSGLFPTAGEVLQDLQAATLQHSGLRRAAMRGGARIPATTSSELFFSSFKCDKPIACYMIVPSSISCKLGLTVGLVRIHACTEGGTVLLIHL